MSTALADKAVVTDLLLCPDSWAGVYSSANLVSSWKKAAAGKRNTPAVALFDYRAGEYLLSIQHALQQQTWQPSGYHHFVIQEPKQRLISAAPFADRVVHHALMNVTAQRFERTFISDSYANRVGKGTHRAIQRLQHLSKQYTHVLRLDVAQHFPSIDHEILLNCLSQRIPEPELMRLVQAIITSGDGIHSPSSLPAFEGDDLFDMARPKGLPIGNLTSQFWSNCYLDAGDQFIKRTLGCKGYLRYVDDMALFSNDVGQLREWECAVREFMARRLRLHLHCHSAHSQPCAQGTPWLGMVVYPTHIKVKGRKVVESTRCLTQAYQAWCKGETSFAVFDAKVQGWCAHVAQADSWGLRRHVLGRFDLSAGDLSRCVSH